MVNYKNPGPINFEVNSPAKKGSRDNSSSWIVFPFNVEELFGVKGRVPVKVLFEDIPYRGSLVKMKSDNHQILVLKEIQKQLDERRLNVIHIQLELDTELRKIVLPNDVLEKLNKNKLALEKWNKLAYSHQREYFKWITEAKKEETRFNRIDKMMLMLTKKK